jgi:protein-disulfide isomerase
LDKIKWVIFSVIVVGILAALIIFPSGSKIDVSKVDVNAVQTANAQDGNIADHVFGKIGSKVTLIEYGDFQCPGCGDINPTIVTVTDKYKDQLQFVFRNFPLTTLHANAKSAAAAAEAAGIQGKYWEMHTKIYTAQSDWENLTGTDRTNFFVQFATDLGLNITKFKSDMASTAVDTKISFDQALGFKINIDSTPTFYLDGNNLDSTVWGDSTKLQNAINTELKKAGIALPQSTN